MNIRKLFFGLFLLASVALFPRAAEAQDRAARMFNIDVSHTVFLTWNAATPNGDTLTYNVYRSTTEGGPYNQIAFSVSAFNFADQSVLFGVTYFYVVTTYDASTNLESAYSNETAGVIPAT